MRIGNMRLVFLLCVVLFSVGCFASDQVTQEDRVAMRDIQAQYGNIKFPMVFALGSGSRMAVYENEALELQVMIPENESQHIQQVVGHCRFIFVPLGHMASHGKQLGMPLSTFLSQIHNASDIPTNGKLELQRLVRDMYRHDYTPTESVQQSFKQCMENAGLQYLGHSEFSD